MAQNECNFKRSASPTRVMFYHEGFWVDFPNNVVSSLRCAFEKNETKTQLKIGDTNYIFDYIRMIQIDLEFGKQRSIAWIDDKNKCFFPQTFVESTDDEPTDDELGSSA